MQGAGLGGLQVIGAEVNGLVAVVQGLLVVVFRVVRAGDHWAVARSHDCAEFLEDARNGYAKLWNHFLRVDAGLNVNGEGLSRWLGGLDRGIYGGSRGGVGAVWCTAVCYTVVQIPGGQGQE